MLSSFYNSDDTLGKEFDILTKKYFIHILIKYLVTRVKKYNPMDVFKTEEESDALGTNERFQERRRRLKYAEIEGNTDGYMQVVRDVIGHIG